MWLKGAGSRDLGGAVLEALCVAQQEMRGAGECRFIGGLPAQRGFRRESRQGLCATPPNASRASVIVFPSSSSAAATDTSANAKERRSRIFLVGVACCKATRRKLGCGDDLVRLQISVALRHVLR
jgi:hypothetical protein